MRNLSIKWQTVLAISLFCIAIIAGIYIFSVNKLSGEFLEFEEFVARKNLARTKDTILFNREVLINKLSDWAQWDDAYQFLLDKNNQFKKSNLQNNLTALKVDVLGFWTLDKKLVWGTNLDFKTDDDLRKKYPMSDLDIGAIQNIESLYQFKSQKDRNYAFVQLSEGPYLLVSAPITSTDGKSSIRGSLIGGIKLNTDYFINISKTLHLNVEPINLETPNVTTKESEIIKELDDKDHLIKLDNSNFLNVYSSINDYRSKKLILYKIVVPREIHLLYKHTLDVFLIAMMFGGVAMVLVVLISVNRLLISRISTLSDLIIKIKETGDLKQRVPELGGDEIGQLGKSFNEMFEEVEQLRAASFQNEKMASLGEMAGGIAHEINNPITMISASASIMKKMLQKGTVEPEKYLKHIEEIDKTVIRISKIITGLRNVSRNADEEEFSQCSLHDILTDSLSVCSEKFKARGIAIKINFDDPTFQIKIPCLRVQLSQVLFNLLSNAFDAIEGTQNPWIEITAKQVDNMLVIHFLDSGHGIPKDIQNKIFQPFFTTKEVGKGTGLGLSLCNTIIQRHHGFFAIDNECKHTCFIIKLPIYNQAI